MGQPIHRPGLSGFHSLCHAQRVPRQRLEPVDQHQVGSRLEVVSRPGHFQVGDGDWLGLGPFEDGRAIR
ncbi:MAG: hypothetical protein ABEK29_08175, partial [Bradymonadaceae bacterium]